MNPPITPARASSTMTTAADRGTRRLVSQLTTGSRPAAMNSARPMSTSTERARIASSSSAMVMATPAAPAIPMNKGERRSIGLPSRPRPPVSSACLAATLAASSTGCVPPSFASRPAVSVVGTRTATVILRVPYRFRP